MSDGLNTTRTNVQKTVITGFVPNRAKVVEVSDGNVNGWHTWEGFFHVFNYALLQMC